ncbi:MAG: S8 family serine peptidase [Pseudomonadota bacterium]
MSDQTSNANDDSNASTSPHVLSVASDVESLLINARQQAEPVPMTGRHLVSYHPEHLDAGMSHLQDSGFRIADARDFDDQSVRFHEAGDAEALVFPELGIALVGGDAMEARETTAQNHFGDHHAVHAVEHEHFVFAHNQSDYLRGFLRATELIYAELAGEPPKVESSDDPKDSPEIDALTWGLEVCGVSKSAFSGKGIKVAVLDTGLDLSHPDFQDRAIQSSSFVNEDIDDIYGHGTHCAGIACGPQAASSGVRRYGVAYGADIYIGKVLTNSGSGAGAYTLAGMNWAIANNCEVISMSVGGQHPVQEAYTKAGAAALAKGLLMIAATGNMEPATDAPANSPTVVSVGSLDTDLKPSFYSDPGKVDFAAKLVELVIRTAVGLVVRR